MNVDLANQIHTSNAMDKVVLDALAAAKSIIADWIFQDDLIIYQKQCYISAD